MVYGLACSRVYVAGRRVRVRGAKVQPSTSMTLRPGASKLRTRFGFGPGVLGFRGLGFGV